MSDHEQDKFEAELRQLKPGKLPEDLVARIQTAVSTSPVHSSQTAPRAPLSAGFLQILRWLVPATAAILIAAVVWHRQQDSGEPVASTVASQETAPTTPSPTEPLLRADNIQIGKELVSSFDAVATLPGGEPVRFRCQQWISKVVVDDERLGLLVESRSPRVVVVPVGFETY